MAPDPRTCLCASCLNQKLLKIAAYAALQNGGEFRAPFTAPPGIEDRQFMLHMVGDEIVALLLSEEEVAAYADLSGKQGGLDA